MLEFVVRNNIITRPAIDNYKSICNRGQLQGLVRYLDEIVIGSVLSKKVFVPGINVYDLDCELCKDYILCRAEEYMN